MHRNRPRGHLFTLLAAFGALLTGRAAPARAVAQCPYGWTMLKDGRTRQYKCCPKGSGYSTIAGQMTCTTMTTPLSPYSGTCPSGRSVTTFVGQRFCCPAGMRVARFGAGYRCDAPPAPPLACPDGHWVSGLGRFARCVRGCPPGYLGHRIHTGQTFCCPSGHAVVRSPNGAYICWKSVPGHPRGGFYSCPPGYAASQATDGKSYCCPFGSRAQAGAYGSVQCVAGAAPAQRCGADLALYLSNDRRSHACCLPSAPRVPVGNGGVRCGSSPRCGAGGTLYRRPNGTWSCCGPGLVGYGYICRGPSRPKACGHGQRAFYAPSGAGFCCQAGMYGVAVSHGRVLCYR